MTVMFASMLNYRLMYTTFEVGFLFGFFSRAAPNKDVVEPLTIRRTCQVEVV